LNPVQSNSHRPDATCMTEDIGNMTGDIGKKGSGRILEAVPWSPDHHAPRVGIPLGRRSRHLAPRVYSAALRQIEQRAGWVARPGVLPDPPRSGGAATRAGNTRGCWPNRTPQAAPPRQCRFSCASRSRLSRRLRAATRSPSHPLSGEELSPEAQTTGRVHRRKRRRAGRHKTAPRRHGRGPTRAPRLARPFLHKSRCARPDCRRRPMLGERLSRPARGRHELGQFSAGQGPRFCPRIAPRVGAARTRGGGGRDSDREPRPSDGSGVDSRMAKQAKNRGSDAGRRSRKSRACAIRP
jgi:hypothetical protein